MDPAWKRKMYYLPHLVGDKDNSAKNCKIEKGVYCTPVLVLFCLPAQYPLFFLLVKCILLYFDSLFSNPWVDCAMELSVQFWPIATRPYQG